MLHTVAMLIRAHREVTFHWSTAVRGLCTMLATGLTIALPRAFAALALVFAAYTLLILALTV